MFNDPNFFTIRQLDLENKLILPTTKLYDQVSFQLNALYQDIRSVLIDAHYLVSATAKQLYEHPVATMTAWYEQAAYTGTALYAQAQAVVTPVYQHWQIQVTTGKEQTIQFLQAFWANPEQVTLATFEPVTRYVAAFTEQSERYWQLFIDSPEQFTVTALAPVTGYLSSLSQDAEAVLISSYYALADLFSLLMAQPSATVEALYHNTLSFLLDVYFDVISSLVMV
ncbi:hypothetical protein ABXJ76_14235 [Methylobacter sp. G7]|uniref:hypothetical protein n=1 Tax=Methylobacter sp. G7 TaxID=3230117 RepID=UPI003D809CC9